MVKPIVHLMMGEPTEPAINLESLFGIMQAKVAVMVTITGL